jgi:hypothetical protein
MLRVKTRIRTVAETKRHIERALGEVDNGLVGGNLELNVGVVVLEAVQAGGEPARDVGGNGRDAKADAFTPIDAGHGALDFRQRTPNADGEPLALGRHLDPARVPDEKGSAELLLELGNAVTYRTCRDAELVARLLEALQPCGGFEYTQRIEGRQAAHREYPATCLRCGALAAA